MHPILIHCTGMDLEELEQKNRNTSENELPTLLPTSPLIEDSLRRGDRDVDVLELLICFQRSCKRFDRSGRLWIQPSFADKISDDNFAPMTAAASSIRFELIMVTVVRQKSRYYITNGDRSYDRNSECIHYSCRCGKLECVVRDLQLCLDPLKSVGVELHGRIATYLQEETEVGSIGVRHCDFGRMDNNGRNSFFELLVSNFQSYCLSYERRGEFDCQAE